MVVPVQIKLLSPKAKIPTYSYGTDACFDIYSIEDWIFRPGERHLTHTGIAVYFNPGWEIQIRPRSGMSLKGFILGNSPGTIDYGYTNEILINLVNIGEYVAEIKEGDRIAQGCLKPVYKTVFHLVDEFPKTDRGLNGWGSTGV